MCVCVCVGRFANYADNQAFPASTPTKARSLLLHLQQSARNIGLDVNADIIEFICFKQDGAISILNWKTLKLIDCFTNLSTNISPAENYFYYSWRSYE